TTGVRSARLAGAAYRITFPDTYPPPLPPSPLLPTPGLPDPGLPDPGGASTRTPVGARVSGAPSGSMSVASAAIVTVSPARPSARSSRGTGALLRTGAGSWVTLTSPVADPVPSLTVYRISCGRPPPRVAAVVASIRSQRPSMMAARSPEPAPAAGA